MNIFGLALTGIAAIAMGCRLAYLPNVSEKLKWGVLSVILPVIFGVICGAALTAFVFERPKSDVSEFDHSDLVVLTAVVTAIVGTPFAVLMAIWGWAAAYTVLCVKRLAQSGRHLAGRETIPNPRFDANHSAERERSPLAAHHKHERHRQCGKANAISRAADVDRPRSTAASAC